MQKFPKMNLSRADSEGFYWFSFLYFNLLK